jgi:hypothetical protein
MITIKKLQKSFTQISNIIVNDNKMSMQAIGLFCYIWSKPDDWQYYKSEMMKRFNCGKDALATAINSLQDNNYLFIQTSRGEDGKFTKSIWYLSDEGKAREQVENVFAEQPNTAKPEAGNPHAENPQAENPHLLILNNSKTNINNKYNSFFETFWQKYEPIHTSKGSKKDAEKKFSKIIKKESFDDIMAGLEKYMAHCKTKNSYTKAVSTWLNSEGWKDDYNNGIAEDKFEKLKDFVNDEIGEIVVRKVAIENNKGLFYITSTQAGDKLFTSSQDIKEKIKNEFNKISIINNFEKR